MNHCARFSFREGLANCFLSVLIGTPLYVSLAGVQYIKQHMFMVICGFRNYAACHFLKLMFVVFRCGFLTIKLCFFVLNISGAMSMTSSDTISVSNLHEDVTLLQLAEHFGMIGTVKVGAAVSNQTVNDGVAHSKNPTKCVYHVTFDLDLEHTLDAR